MGNSCQGKIALVTGASRGIGRAIAVRLASEGANVAVVARPAQEGGESDYGTLAETVAQIQALGRKAIALPYNLGNQDLDCTEIVDQVEAQLGQVDLLVNNVAGGGYKNIEDWTDKQVATVLQLNFWVPWRLARRCLPGMKQKGCGSILNISSTAAHFLNGPPFVDKVASKQGTIYGGTKAFLNRWSESLASELYDTGINVNTLAPQAASATEILVATSGIPDIAYEPLSAMAEAALALCTGDSNVLTGQIVCSLDLLLKLQRPIYKTDGSELEPGWQPEDLPAAIEGMEKFKKGELGTFNLALPSSSNKLTS